MKNWISKNLNSIIVMSFLVPILLVAFVSISHVTTFYGLANPFSWAVYLSIAVEIAALAALAGVSAGFGRFIYIPFFIVTFIQLLGNFFFSFTWIDVDSEQFKDWMSMVGPILEPMGIDAEATNTHRTLLAFFTGGLLPFISLTFAHMLIVYADKTKNPDTTEPLEITPEQFEEISKKVEKPDENKTEFVPNNEELDKFEDMLKKYMHVEVNKENTTEDNNVEEVVTDEENVYFIDEEPVQTGSTPSDIKRLNYTKG